VIHPDGNIWMVDVVESSGSHSLGRPQFVRERFSVVMARMVPSCAARAASALLTSAALRGLATTGQERCFSAPC
jgi:hypothetical protein